MKIKTKIKAIIVNLIFVLGFVLVFNQVKILRVTGLLFIAIGLIFNIIIIANSNDKGDENGKKKEK